MQGQGGTGPGLNRGASMSGNKAGGSSTVIGMSILVGAGTTQNATITAPRACEALIWVFGPGGGAPATDAGGGGGGAAFKRTMLSQGQSIALQAGAAVSDTNGGTSSAALPSGVIVQATGGLKGSGGVGGNGGSGSGGDINRAGGKGGNPTSPDGFPSPDVGGGAGGLSTGTRGGGGGSAGFGDFGDYLIGGAGGTNGVNPSYGGGSWGLATPGASRVVVVLLSV